MNERFVYARDRSACSPTGDRHRFIFRKAKSASGFPALVEVGRQDFQEVIDSFAHSCDICTLIKRYELGDTSVLARVQGVYADVTDLPNDLMTAHEILNNARRTYDSLTEEQKRDFGTFDQFLAGVHTMINNPDLVTTPKKEVNDNES